MRPVKRGDKGKQVVDIQTRLAALGYFLGREGADGVFGPHTEKAVRTFQQQRLLYASGVVDENTWTELVEAGFKPGDRLLYLRVPYMRGDDVLYLQRCLDELGFDCGPLDGIFSPALEVAVTEFQRNAGLNVDGIVGETTLERLRLLKKEGFNAQTASIPDRMNGYVGVHSFSELRVSIDPAHGGSDPGEGEALGKREKDVNLALAKVLTEKLRERGAEVYLIRGKDTTLSLYKRTELAGAWEPHIHLCVHHSWSRSSKPCGAATYFFANQYYRSMAGKRLAGYIVDALVRELGRVDLHTHGRNYACLREVKPLSVMAELGYLSHPEEGLQLVDPKFLEREADAIVKGIESYLARE